MKEDLKKIFYICKNILNLISELVFLILFCDFLYIYLASAHINSISLTIFCLIKILIKIILN